MNGGKSNRFLPPVLGYFKEDMLAILCKARENSDREVKGNTQTEIWRRDVWKNIETTAQAFLSREAEKLSYNDQKSVEDRLENIARAFHHAKVLIDRELPDKAFVRHGFGPGYKSLLKAWQWGETETARLNKQQTPHIGEIEKRFVKALEAVAILERAANLAAEKRPKKPGRPAEHLGDVVIGLAHVYEQATGRKAGKGDGPFAKFVDLFLKAIEYARSDVIKLIKRALSEKNVH